MTWRAAAAGRRPVAGSPSRVVGLWEGEAESPPPPASDFGAWLAGEPPMREWAKIRTQSAEMKEVKKMKQENFQ